jgi:hypothetical protein
LGKLDRIDLAGLARHERAVARDPAASWPAKMPADRHKFSADAIGEVA